MTRDEKALLTTSLAVVAIGGLVIANCGATQTPIVAIRTTQVRTALLNHYNRTSEIPRDKTQLDRILAEAKIEPDWQAVYLGRDSKPNSYQYRVFSEKLGKGKAITIRFGSVQGKALP